MIESFVVLIGPCGPWLPTDNLFLGVLNVLLQQYYRTKKQNKNKSKQYDNLEKLFWSPLGVPLLGEQQTQFHDVTPKIYRV